MELSKAILLLAPWAVAVALKAGACRGQQPPLIALELAPSSLS